MTHERSKKCAILKDIKSNMKSRECKAELRQYEANKSENENIKEKDT